MCSICNFKNLCATFKINIRTKNILIALLDFQLKYIKYLFKALQIVRVNIKLGHVRDLLFV